MNLSKVSFGEDEIEIQIGDLEIEIEEDEIELEIGDNFEKLNWRKMGSKSRLVR